MIRNVSILISVMMVFFVSIASAQDKKTSVLALMDKAAAHYSAVGQEQAFKDFAVKGGDFYFDEYYVLVQDLNKDIYIFHAVNPKLAGKNLMKIKDTDGVALVAEMSKVAKTKGSGWVSYKWPNPETKKIAQKHTYVQRVDDVMLMIGYYE
jgi:cytochrome c